MCSGPRAGRARTRGRFRIGFQCFSRPICFSRNSIPFSTRTYHQPFSPALCHSVQLPFASFSPPSNSGSEHRCHAFPTLFLISFQDAAEELSGTTCGRRNPKDSTCYRKLRLTAQMRLQAVLRVYDLSIGDSAYYSQFSTRESDILLRSWRYYDCKNGAIDADACVKPSANGTPLPSN